MRPEITIIAAILLSTAIRGRAQRVMSSAGTPAVTAEPLQTGGEAWSFGATFSAYIVPDAPDYVCPVFTADRDWMHLEARYNYEAMDTASLWLGYNFSFGEKWEFEVTPMLGGIFGDTHGIAPGYRFSLSRGRFELYSEGELVFDTHSSSDSFFYTWSELTWSPDGKFRIGLAGQRTRAYQTDLDIQRGILAGYTWKSLDFTACVLNPDKDEPTLVFTMGVEF